MSAYTGGFVDLPDWPLPVVFDLSTLELQDNATQVPLLYEHDNLRGVGHFEVSITDEGVSGTGYLSEPGEDNDRVVLAARAGKEWQLSVGVAASMEHVEEIPEGRSFTANNRTLHGPALLVKRGLLRETSFVQAGADQSGAIATLLASLRPQDTTGADKMGFEAWVAEQGFELDKLTAKQLASLRVQFEAQGNNLSDADDIVPDEENADDSASDEDNDTSDEGSADDQTSDFAADRAAEVERIQSLERVAAGFPANALTVTRNGQEVNLLASALRDGTSAQAFELSLLRNQRPQRMNASRRSSGGQNSSEMLTSMVFSIMASVNARPDFDFNGNRSALTYFEASGARSTLLAKPEDAKRYALWEASHQYRHHDLFEMMASLMAAEGIECTAPRKSDTWFKAAFASNTVVDLFTTSGQAVLLDTFMQHAETYEALMAIVQQVDLPNFLTNERKTVSPDSGEMERLNPTATATDAHLSSTGEEYKIARYAKRWGVDDQDMINEQFGVFREMPQFLGRQSAQLAAQLICKILLTNPNLADGSAWCSGSSLRASSALTNANMKAALTAFGKQTDGSVTLDLRPDTLVVPSELQFTAAEVLDAAPLITGNTTTQTSRNVLAGRIQRIVDTALLDNGFNDPSDRSTAVAGNNSSWWLFDSRYPPIELGHLVGTSRGPQIRTGTYSDGKYGVWFDVKRDVGAAALRRESAQRNNA